MAVDLDEPAAIVAGRMDIESSPAFAPGGECKRAAAGSLPCFQADREPESSAAELSKRPDISACAISLAVQRREVNGLPRKLQKSTAAGSISVHDLGFDDPLFLQ
jgi:hypothetical protein